MPETVNHNYDFIMDGQSNVFCACEHCCAHGFIAILLDSLVSS